MVLAHLGDRLGLYRAMADGEPVTAEQVADCTGTNPRLVHEWLRNEAVGGYVSYDLDEGTFRLPPQHAFALADESSPALIQGLFDLVAAVYQSIEGSDAATLARCGQFCGRGNQRYTRAMRYGAYRPENGRQARDKRAGLVRVGSGPALGKAKPARAGRRLAIVSCNVRVISMTSRSTMMLDHDSTARSSGARRRDSRVSAVAASAIWSRFDSVSRWSGIPLVVGLALYLPQFTGSKAVRISQGILMAVGCCWLAWSVGRIPDRRGAPSGHPDPTAAGGELG